MTVKPTEPLLCFVGNALATKLGLILYSSPGLTPTILAGILLPSSFDHASIICFIGGSKLSGAKMVPADMPQKFRKWWIRYGDDLHKRIQGL